MASKAPNKSLLAAQKMKSSMKNMWDFAKKDLIQNGPQVKQEFKDMIDYARTKTQMLKRPGPTEISVQLERVVNMDVGGDLLTHYKEQWSDIHGATQLSGQEAAILDAELVALCRKLFQSHSIIQRCHDEFSRLPETITAIEETQKKVSGLGELLLQVEESITECSRVKAKLDCERKEHSVKIQYEKHTIESESKLEQLKNILAHEKLETAGRKNHVASKKLKERQNTFQSMFNEQMADYREKGSVERPIGDEDMKERAGSILEDVVIDDKDGSASLDNFLSDVVLEDVENKQPLEDDN